MSIEVEESRIRRELEMDVERDLEEEIKDGIHHLALKLHGLYQLKKHKCSDQKNTREYMSEVNINIRMEGGTIIQVKEIKDEGSRINRPTTTKSQQNVGVTPHQMKFNWEKSLRSKSDSSIFIEKFHPKRSVGYINPNAKHGSCAILGSNNEVLKPRWKH